jgi:uncharacterized protein (TIGR03663 family)
MKRVSWLVVAAVAAGALLRLPQLDLRPMHTDEAVHAVKFGALLETGVYRYDRDEYHGPTLNYLTLISAWLRSEKTLIALTETTLRIVPAFFGLGLLFLPLLLKRIGAIPTASIIVLTAVSPAMSFYSRYYIQETLLVFFTFALIVAGYRLTLSARISWAIIAGACAGLMFATKETWIIPCGAIGISLVVVWLLGQNTTGKPRTRCFRYAVASVVSGAVVWVMLFSSFFTHWQGVIDSLQAYQTYFNRATGNSAHLHPWYYYLNLLAFWKTDQGPIWSEGAILILGCVGFLSAWRKCLPTNDNDRYFRWFVACYAAVMFVVCSAIPYKTPWVMLGTLHGSILIAGFGVEQVVEWCAARHVRWLGMIIMCVLVLHLCWQSYLANFRYYESPANPYVYAHTSNECKIIVEELMGKIRESPSGLFTPVQVVVSEDQYWPLPWYLRSLPRVGWWNKVEEGFVATPIVLASRDVEPSVLQHLYETPPPGVRALYVPLYEGYLQLRPGIEIAGYVRLDFLNGANLGAR